MALMMRFHLNARRVALGAIAVVATAGLGTAAGLSIAAAAPSYQAGLPPSAEACPRRADLRAGQTFDQIAGAKKSAVESDVLSTLQARLSKAVGVHRITQAQADTRLANAKTALETL